jgi:uncharacterized MAPEG superfamily protein
MDIFAFASFPVLVAWSVGLLIVHIMLQARFSTHELGTRWNTGPRDSHRKPQGVFAGRAERASRNFRETYPAFVGLALALAVADPSSLWGRAGALIWFAARILYIPLYLAGIPYIRSGVWCISLAGLAIMFCSVLF